MNDKRLILGGVLAMFAGAASAQSVSVLGKDNMAFARELYRRGFTDLAEGLCKAIEQGGKDGKIAADEVTAVRALYLDLQLDTAKREPDPTKRKDLIEGILKDKRDFISNHYQSPEATETRENLPEVYSALGEALIQAIEKEQDLGVAAKLRREGQEAYDQATKSLEDQRDRTKQQLDAIENLDSKEYQDAESQYITAYYNLARTYYFNARLYPQGDNEKKRLLVKAKDLFLEFSLDYGQTQLSFEGLIFMGLAYKDMGGDENFNEALQSFDDAIRLRETYEEENGRYMMSEGDSDLVSGAVLQKLNLLLDLKRYDEVDAEAETFFKTTPEPEKTEKGLAILAVQAEALLTKGDGARAQSIAERLVKYDPQGPWGAKGNDVLRRILGGGGGASDFGAEKLLNIARSQVQNANPFGALPLLAQVRNAAVGDKNEQNLGAEALFWTGIAYSEHLDNKIAAAIAWEAASDLYPKGALAPDAIAAAASAWRNVNKETKYAYFTRRVDECLDKLLQRYPNHPKAAERQLEEGKKLEDEGKFLEAAQEFLKIKPDSAVYRKAQIRAATDLYVHATALIEKEKKTLAEAKPFLDQIEPIVNKHVPELEKEMAKSLDPKVQSDFASDAFQGRKILANTYLKLGQPTKVLKLLEDVDSKYAAFANSIGQAWALRIQAYKDQGDVNKAMALIDSLVQQDPKSPAIPAAAAELARYLDEQASKEREKRRDSGSADDLQKKARNYYKLSVARQLAGSDTVNAERMEAIAQRLFIFGLDVNRLPESQLNFIGANLPNDADMSFFEDAAQLLDTSLKTSPSYRAQMTLGRCYGFLARWKEAEGVYGTLFDREKILEIDGKSLNRKVLGIKPELVSAYLEFGVVQHLAALGGRDETGFANAYSVFEIISAAYKEAPESALYWQSRYYLIKNLFDRGKFQDAEIALRSLERNTGPDFEGNKFGLKASFLKLKAEISTKIFK